MAHRIRDELSIMQTAADFLINDGSIPTDARDKIALLKAPCGQKIKTAGKTRGYPIPA
jgi:hypothetical protein